jgi:hypothetical protein
MLHRKQLRNVHSHEEIGSRAKKIDDRPPCPAPKILQRSMNHSHSSSGFEVIIGSGAKPVGPDAWQ